MVTAAKTSEEAAPEVEQRILLANVPWTTYVVLRDTVPNAGVKMTYYKGWLEIVSPSPRHEVDKKQLARFIELFCLERDIPLFPYGSMTLREEEAERGLEPDECYMRNERKDRPDFAIEVVVTKDAIDKLEVYRGLGIREVWRFEREAFTIFALRDSGYEPIPASEVLPELDLERLVHFALDPDHHAALKAFRDELRR